MSGSKQLKIGRFHFPSIRALIAKLSEILNRYDLLQRVSDPEDEELLHEVLKRHPNAREKTKGMAVVKFEVHPYIRNERTFYFYLSDGSRDNFSIKKCVQNAVHDLTRCL